MAQENPNRIFIFPSCFEHPRKFIDARQRECLAFDNLQAQTIPQNSVVASSEYVNINSIWHDAGETPERGEQCLVDMTFIFEGEPEENFRDFITSTFGVDGWTEDSMPRSATEFELHRWCYIKDLIPKGGEYEYKKP